MFLPAMDYHYNLAVVIFSTLAEARVHIHQEFRLIPSFFGFYDILRAPLTQFYFIEPYNFL